MMKFIFAVTFLLCLSSFSLAQQANKARSKSVKNSDRNRVLQVLSHPAAAYTDEARKNQVSGYITLLVILRADGTIGDNIKVICGLPFGLNEEAIKAAKKITFVPAKINNKLVSVGKVFQYNFNLY